MYVGTFSIGWWGKCVGQGGMGVCVFTCMFVGVYTHVYICMYFGKMKLKLVSIQDKSICIYWSNILAGWLFKALSVAVCIESTSEKSWLELISLVAHI